MHPEEMTVVLQHQYEDLTVDADQFSVKLRFGGLPKHLVMPYSAITRFYDPSVQFLLQFEEPEIVEPVEEEPTPPKDVPPISDSGLHIDAAAPPSFPRDIWRGCRAER